MLFPRYFLPALVLFVGGEFAMAQSVVNSTYLGQCQGNYSDPNCWSPAEVPNNTASRRYAVSIGSSSAVNVDIDATVSSLFLAGYLNVTDKTFAISDSTMLDVSASPTVAGVNAPALFDAGTLVAFENNTLRGHYTVLDQGSPATLQFKGADIHVLSAGSLTFQGAHANVIDENGNDALANLARVESSAALTLDAHTLRTSVLFTNLGTITLGNFFESSVFEALAGLGNFDSASGTLAGGSFQVGVKETYWPYSNAVTEFRFAGADVVNNGSDLKLTGPSARITDLTGNDGLRNLARNLASGSLTLEAHDFTTAGSFDNDGSLALIGSAFTIAGPLSNFDLATRTISGGNFSLTGGGVLRFVGADIVHNSASITVQLGSGITDLAGNNAFRNFTDNQAAGSFTVDKGYLFTASGDFTNKGGIETIHSHPAIHEPIWQSGEFRVPAGSAYMQTAGATVNGGIFTADNINISGGSFSGAGSIKGNLIVSNGTVVPGGTIDGNLTIGSNARLHSKIAQYSIDAWSQITGAVSLAGTLEIEMTGSVFPASTDIITLVQSTGPFTGTFSNAPNGTRITTTDGSGSFVVFYEANKVKLTAFQASPLPARLLNISTRAFLSRADDDPFGDRAVLIGGFIVSGTEPKKVVVRGIGPSLGKAGVTPTLTDPTLELHASDGTTIATNDNWKDTQQSELASSGLAPADDRESALVTTLDPGMYTVVIREKNGLAGNGLVEIYDTSGGNNSKLANISTRGFTDGTNILIGGIIAAGDGQANAELVVRAIGPQLRRNGIFNALDDPMLEVRDANGNLIAFNDDWVANYQQIPGDLQPHFNQESALRLSLPRGNYTAIVRAKSNSGGVALVEFYDLRR